MKYQIKNKLNSNKQYKWDNKNLETLNNNKKSSNNKCQKNLI